MCGPNDEYYGAFNKIQESPKIERLRCDASDQQTEKYPAWIGRRRRKIDEMIRIFISFLGKIFKIPP